MAKKHTLLCDLCSLSSDSFVNRINALMNSLYRKLSYEPSILVHTALKVTEGSQRVNFRLAVPNLNYTESAGRSVCESILFSPRYFPTTIEDDQPREITQYGEKYSLSSQDSACVATPSPRVHTTNIPTNVFRYVPRSTKYSPSWFSPSIPDRNDRISTTLVCNEERWRRYRDG